MDIGRKGEGGGGTQVIQFYNNRQMEEEEKRISVGQVLSSIRKTYTNTL